MQSSRLIIHVHVYSDSGLDFARSRVFVHLPLHTNGQIMAEMYYIYNIKTIHERYLLITNHIICIRLVHTNRYP